MAKVDRTSATTVPTVTLPPPPSKSLTIDGLLDYWRSIPVDLSHRITGDLYRLWPIIQRDPRYIDKIAAPPRDANAILRSWGTGRYDLCLNDYDGRKGREICRARFKFDDLYADQPPVLEVTELDVHHAENQAYVNWLRSKGMLKMPEAAPPPTPPAQPDASVGVLAEMLRALLAQVQQNNRPREGSEASFAKMMEMFSAANKTALEMAFAQVKQESPAATIEMLTKLQALFGPREQAANPMMQFVLDELKEERKANRDLQNKLLEARDKPSAEDGLKKSLTDRLLESAIDNLLNGGGDGTARRTKWYETLVPYAPQALQILDKFATGFGFAMRARQPQPGVSVPGAVPLQPAAAVPLPGAGADAQPNPAPDEDPMKLQLLQFFQQIWQPMMNHLTQGARGEEFADFVAAGWGMNLADHAQIKAIGRDQIITYARMSPAWAQVAPIEQQFATFLDQFLAWTPDWADRDDEPTPPPSGPIPINLPPRAS